MDANKQEAATRNGRQGVRLLTPARPHALKYTRNKSVMWCESASPRALTTSLSRVELVAANNVV